MRLSVYYLLFFSFYAFMRLSLITDPRQYRGQSIPLNS